MPGAHALTLTEATKKVFPKDEETDAGFTALLTSGKSVFSGSLLPEAFFRDLLGAHNVVAAEFLKACISARVPCLAMTLSDDHAHLLEQRLSEDTLHKFGDSECPSLFMSDYKKPVTAPSKNKPATVPENGAQPEAGATGSPEKPKGTGDKKSGGKKRGKSESTGSDSPKKQKRNMKRAVPRRRRRSRTLKLLRHRRPCCCQAVTEGFECGS